MTLFKQLALVISFITVVTLGSVMYINYESAKKDMIENLHQSTVNNISSLVNNLAETGGEREIIKSVIDAEFDSGYYKQIKFTSSDQSFMYEQIDNEPIDGVPLWFINFTTIELKSVRSDVISGWSSVGEVEVLGDSGVVYKALYTMVKNLLYLFGILAIISHIILSILLHFVLKPLREIQHQAEAILKNEFLIQKKEPYTTEFKNVVRGMNSMVKKVEDIFNKANESAQRNRELLYNDPVTKLYNRRYLMLKLPEFLRLELGVDGGSIFFIALSSVEIIEQMIGKQASDALLEAFANSLQLQTKKYEDVVCARVNEREFMLVVAGCESSNALKIATRIQTKFQELQESTEIDPQQLSLNIGLYRYKQNVKIKELLTCADSALSHAKADEKIKIFLYKESQKEHTLGKEAWRSILEDAIAQENFKLKFWSMLNTTSKKLSHKVMTFTLEDKDNKEYFYGDFIVRAINLGVVGKMYLIALKKLLTSNSEVLQAKRCSIRLSNEFLKDQSSLEKLSQLLDENIKNIDFEIAFEISDNFALNNRVLVKSFVDMFTTYDIEFGINAFTGDSDDFSYLKELSPLFIKADASFLLDQTQDSMSALHVITDSLSIDIIATFVKTEEELQRLQVMHIHHIQGPLTDTIELIES